MADPCCITGVATLTPTSADFVTATKSPVGTEILDDPAADPALVRRMLGDIERTNRWFGGRRAMRHGLSYLIDRSDRGRHLTLLDVGTGAGDLPLDAARWAARRGITLGLLGLERIPAAARLARLAGFPVMIGCAGSLPLRARSVDIVLVSQLVHHLDGTAASALALACSTIARRGVIIADLRQSRLAAAAFPVGARFLRLHPATITDGVTSIARGFSVATLRDVVERAGQRSVHVATVPIARVVAAWRTDR